MQRVTIKQVCDFYDTHRENFANYITKGIHTDLVMNSECTPAELLDKWNKAIASGRHIALNRERFQHYYPNVDYAKRYEIGDVITQIIGESEDESEEEHVVPVKAPVEEVVQEHADKYVADEEAEQLVNEINNKVEANAEVNEDNAINPYEIIQNTDLHDKTLFIKFSRGSKTLFKDIKPVIIEKLNEFKPLSDLFVKVFYKIDGNPIPKPTTFSLSNNIGMQKMKMLLDGKTYELLENVYDANG
jgi:hypothetical protein